MRQKKMISRILTILATGAVSALAAVSVQAAQIPTTAVTIDYTEQRLLIQETGDALDHQVYVSFPNPKNSRVTLADGSKQQVKVLAGKDWDIYDNTAAGITVDLSTLSTTKDHYIQLKGDKNTDVLTIKIPAVLSKVSAKFVATSAAVKMYNTTNSKAPVELTEGMEYRTVNGNWTAYQGESLETYQMNGATLHFRIAGHVKETLDVTATTPQTGGMKDSSGNDISVYQAGSFPGKAIKVAVPKRAAAPKAKVDYTARQFTLPKGTEYRVVTTDAFGQWTSPADAKSSYKLTLSELSQAAGSLDGALEVRVAATDKRAASKVTQVSLEQPAKLDVCSSKEGLAEADIPDSDIFYNSIGKDLSDVSVMVGYISNQTTKEFQGLSFFNYTQDVYEVYVAQDGKVPDSSTSPTIKIAPDKKGSEDGKQTDLKSSKVANGDKIYIRKVGDSKNQQWSSEYVCLGTVKYDPSVHAR
jgi:hypothetical protein